MKDKVGRMTGNCTQVLHPSAYLGILHQSLAVVKPTCVERDEEELMPGFS